MFQNFYAILIEPRDNCPPLSTLGFFLRGAGVGASPVIHEGICEELVVTAGPTGAPVDAAGILFFPRPVMLFNLFPKSTVCNWVHFYVTVRKFRTF